MSDRTCCEPGCIEQVISYQRCPIHAISHIGWEVDCNTGCHMWRGVVNGKGYGLLADSSRTRVHRLSWMLANGRDVPSGAIMRHSCDRPGCINPAHLTPGSQRENTWDAISRGRRPINPETIGGDTCLAGHDLNSDSDVYFKSDGKGRRYRRCRQCRRLSERKPSALSS